METSHMMRLGFALLLIGLFLYPLTVPFVQSASAEIINEYNFNLLLEVNGYSYILGASERIYIPGNSTVCLPSAYETIYAGLDIRYKFVGWVLDDRLTGEGTCVNVPSGSVVKPFYITEYRVAIASSPRGVYFSETWIPSKSNITISVPEKISFGDGLYVFQGWSQEFLPPKPNVSVIVSSPLMLTALYKAYYPVYVITNTSQGPILVGYVPSGSRVLVSALPLQDEVRISDDTRLVIDALIINNESMKYDPLESIKINEPIYVEPVYRLEYKVVVETAVRSIQAWMPPNSMFDVKTDSIVDINESVRLVFTGWDGINATTPATTIVVEGPVHAKALYKVQYKVVIRSPLGTSSYWADAGSLIPVTLPDRLPGVIYDRVLSHYIVNSKPVTPGEGGVVFLPVDRPLDVTAVYVVQLNWYHLGVALAFVLALIAIYLAYDIYTRSGEEEKEEEEGS